MSLWRGRRRRMSGDFPRTSQEDRLDPDNARQVTTPLGGETSDRVVDLGSVRDQDRPVETQDGDPT